MTQNGLPATFDIGTAALEHLELLNSSNLNPLEIAAQFRTLLRRKKTPENCLEPNYIDYRIIDQTNRRRASKVDPRKRSKSSGRIEYFLDESPISTECQSSWPLTEDQQLTEDIFDESTSEHFESNSSITSNEVRPKISWSQLKEIKKNEIASIDSSKSIISTDSEQKSIFRTRSSSNSIRTPSVSPISSPRPVYTISRWNSASVNNSDEDILFPLADCNLIIRQKQVDRQKSS